MTRPLLMMKNHLTLVTPEIQVIQEIRGILVTLVIPETAGTQGIQETVVTPATQEIPVTQEIPATEGTQGFNGEFGAFRFGGDGKDFAQNIVTKDGKTLYIAGDTNSGLDTFTMPVMFM